MCTIVGYLVGYFGFSIVKVTTLERKQEGHDVQLNTKLDVLLSNNTEIKGSVKELERKLDNFKDDVNVRLTRVEESCKQAHKRMDTLEAKGGK